MADFWKSSVGMYRVELTSASVEDCFLRMNNAGIRIYEVYRSSELSAGFLIARRDLRKLKYLCNRYGDQVDVCGEVGIYYKFQKAIKRPVLIFGIAAIAALTLLLPRRIWFVEIEGNRNIPVNQIREATEKCGIRFGVTRESIRSEQIKNGLLSQIPELKWAGVNTRGCVAVISVREGTENVDTSEGGIASIVAARDGVIISCTSTSGNLLCKEGHVVKKGQVLISAYTDCGLTIQATRAEGEVFAQTVRSISAVKPLFGRRKITSGSPNHGLSILIGKKRINLWKGSGIWGQSCGRMYQEYYLLLPGGFRLPFALCVEKVTQYETEPAFFSSDDTEPDLINFAKGYLLQDMVAGSVQSGSTEFSQENGLAVLNGNFLCKEMIGRMREEQIGEEHGKTN